MTVTNLLVRFREIIAVSCENRRKHTNALFVQNVDFLKVKCDGIRTVAADSNGCEV
jgi:hypothetical protein